MRAFQAFTLLIALAVVGRGQGKPSPEPEDSYGSPKAVFDAMNKASKKRDFKTVLKCLTPESRDLMVANLVTTGSFLRNSANVGDPKMKALAAEFDKTLAKHGVTKEALAKWATAKNPEEAFKAAKAFAAPVKDKAGFMREVSALIDKLNPGKREQDAGELKDVKITGPKASGDIVWKGGGMEVKQPIDFVKVGRGWLVVVPDVKAFDPPDPILPPPPPEK